MVVPTLGSNRNTPRVRWLAPLALCTSLALTSCALNETADESTGTGTAQGSLNGMGASSMSVAQENWIAGFQTENPRATVIYAPEGSGAGRDAFMGGGADFAGSDRAYDLDENVPGAFVGCADESTALDLPIYISPIAIAFNVASVEELNLTPEVLAAIFIGEITSWSDNRITALNPDAPLPDLQVTAVHRSDNSGTTENFTAYLHNAAGDVWPADPDDAWPTKGGEAAKGTSGVISAVRDGVGTIGYVDASQAGDAALAHIGRDGAFEAARTVEKNDIRGLAAAAEGLTARRDTGVASGVGAARDQAQGNEQAENSNASMWNRKVFARNSQSILRHLPSKRGVSMTKSTRSLKRF